MVLTTQRQRTGLTVSDTRFAIYCIVDTATGDMIALNKDTIVIVESATALRGVKACRGGGVPIDSFNVANLFGLPHIVPTSQAGRVNEEDEETDEH